MFTFYSMYKCPRSQLPISQKTKTFWFSFSFQLVYFVRISENAQLLQSFQFFIFSFLFRSLDHLQKERTYFSFKFPEVNFLILFPVFILFIVLNVDQSTPEIVYFLNRFFFSPGQFFFFFNMLDCLNLVFTVLLLISFFYDKIKYLVIQLGFYNKFLFVYLRFRKIFKHYSN